MRPAVMLVPISVFNIIVILLLAPSPLENHFPGIFLSSLAVGMNAVVILFVLTAYFRTSSSVDHQPPPPPIY